jgi:uncharacterized repeat protein (TIGR02543 family)
MSRKYRQIVGLAVIGLLAASYAYADVGSNWIEQWGIRWTFNKNISTDGSGGTYRYGQFATGEYWVVGPVTVISISPPSENISGRIKNGSMINPPIGNTNGYDNQMSYNTYDHSLNVAFGVSASSPLVVAVNSSLISTISVDAANSRPQVDSAAILTVLSSAPAEGSFRPPYCGTDKTVQFNKSQLNYNKLRKLTPVAYTPSLTAPYGPESSVAAYKSPVQWFQRPWIEHGTEDPGRFIKPLNNCPDYGREVSRYTNWAALLLNLNFSDAQKEPLMIGMVQYGIDLYRIVTMNRTSFVGNGTITSGRLLPILFAGTVLDTATGADALRNIGQKTGQYRYTNGYTSGNLPPDYIHFLETNQTHYVTQTDVDVTNSAGWKPDYRDYEPLPYSQSDIDLPEWGIRNARTPTNNNKQWNTAYRLSSSPVIAGTALVAHIMGIKDLFNQPSMFDYADRYVQYLFSGDYDAWYASNPTGADPPDVWRYGVNGFEFYKNAPFIKNMWDTYRANYPPVWQASGTTPTYILSITATNGSVAKSPNKTTYNSGETVTLTPTANSGYTFGSWAGDATGTTSPLTVTMNADKSVTANFVLLQQVANDNFANGIAIAGSTGQTTGSNTGSTKETGEPSHAGFTGGASIWWYWTAPASGQVTFNTFSSTFDTLLAAYTGSSVGNLTSIASNDDSSGVLQSQITFSAVSGTTYRIAIDGWNAENGSVILNWTLAGSTTYSLAITSTNGTVAKSPNKTAYTSGETVTLTAAPGTGYSFGTWSGDATGSTNPVTITMNGNKAVTANFTQNTYTLAVTSTNGTVAKSPDSATYTYGQTITLTATANAGYSFGSWTGSATGTTNPVTVTMDGNKTVTASFSILPMASCMTAHWMLDENTGATTTDISGYSASLINSPVWGYAWANEDWICLDTQTQAIAIPADAIQAQAGSIALWIEPDDLSGTQFILGHVFNSSNRINLYSVAGKLALGLGSNVALQTNLEDLTVGQPAHIVLTWNGTAYAVYVDTVLKASGTFEGLTALNSTIDVGNYGDPASRTVGFIGVVEDIRTYCRALTGLEINRLYYTYDVYQQKSITFSLPDTYQSTLLPAGATFQNGVFTWQPWYNQVGNYTIVFTATGYPIRIITITVHEAAMTDWYRQFLIYTQKLQ